MPKNGCNPLIQAMSKFIRKVVSVGNIENMNIGPSTSYWCELPCYKGLICLLLLIALTFSEKTIAETIVGLPVDILNDPQEKTGDPKAQFKLCKSYYYGDGVERDEKTAVEWCISSARLYKESALVGNVEAQYRLGRVYNFLGVVKSFSSDKNESKKYYDNTVNWLTKAAESGHTSAQFIIGLFYSNSANVEYYDQDKARFWISKAARSGHSQAVAELGKLYKNTDLERAVELFKKAEKAGSRTGKEELGGYYATRGFYVEAGSGNRISALYYLRQSWLLGVLEDSVYTDIYSNLSPGLLFDLSINNSPVFIESLHSVAAEGDKSAQLFLGLSYFNGDEIEENKGVALEWIEKAALSGDEEAKRWIADYEKKNTYMNK
jgi:TPR repeat protein